ncbi:hypothetical protein LguiA_019488 [Lonicera macranthoides]
MVLFVQKHCLAHRLSPIQENHNHHLHRSSEANSASLQAFSHNPFSKLENHNHHQPSEALLVSLQAFRSHVSNYLCQLYLEPKPGVEFFSLTWIQQCLQLIPMVSQAFAKLLVEIDYPKSKWEASSIDEYLNYTLNLLELLNSISSSLSHLSQARLSLSYAISLIKDSPSLAIERLQQFRSENLNTEFKVPQIEPIKEIFCSGEEDRTIQEAMVDMKKIGSWVCEVVLSSLCSDLNSFMETRKSSIGFFDSSLITLDSCVSKEVVEKQGTLKEVREINEAIDCLVSAMAHKEGDDQAKELKRRLEVLEKGLMDVKNEGDSLFSEILAARNELLEIFRSNSTT